MICEHKNIHTERTKWFPPLSVQIGKGKPIEIDEVKSQIISYCADCGEKIKEVSIGDNLD